MGISEFNLNLNDTGANTIRTIQSRLDKTSTQNNLLIVQKEIYHINKTKLSTTIVLRLIIKQQWNRFDLGKRRVGGLIYLFIYFKMKSF